jgi:hypothetical protein
MKFFTFPATPLTVERQAEVWKRSAAVIAAALEE